MKPLTRDDIDAVLYDVRRRPHQAADRVWALLHERGREMYVYGQDRVINIEFIDLVSQKPAFSEPTPRVLVLNLEAES